MWRRFGDKIMRQLNFFRRRSDAKRVPTFADHAPFQDAFLLRNRSNYGSLMSAGPVSSACNRTREYPNSAIKHLSRSAMTGLDRGPPSSHGKTPQTLIYSDEFRRFEGLPMRQMAVGGQIDEKRVAPV